MSTTLNKVGILYNTTQIFDETLKLFEDVMFEINIQTFVWDKSIPIIKEINKILEKHDKSGKIIKIYVLIDERGFIANLAFNRKFSHKWDTSDIGLYTSENIKVYADTFTHNSFRTNHAKTIIVDHSKYIITGANFQGSNFGHQPACDFGLVITGPSTKNAYLDFADMWTNYRSNKSHPDIGHLADIQYKWSNPESLSKLTFITRPPTRYPSWANNQNVILEELLNNAAKSINVIVPNLNSGEIINMLINATKRKVNVNIVLGKCFNDIREANFIMGGTNQNSVNVLLNKCDNNYLNIRWFSVDGKEPVINNTQGAAHAKLILVDSIFVWAGNANLDRMSIYYAHEATVLIEDPNVYNSIFTNFYQPIFNKSIICTENTGITKVMDSLGFNGMKNLKGGEWSLKILNIAHKSNNMVTVKLERPENFIFNAGQYLEIKSDRQLSKIFKSPAVIAISSGVFDNYLEN